MNQKIFFKLFSLIILMNLFLAPIPLWAMDDTHSKTWITPVKKKGFHELLDSALAGNTDDDELICILLPLTYDLGHWIDPQEALLLLQQKTALGKARAQFYQDKLSKVFPGVESVKGDEDDIKALKKLFKNAVSRNYGPALVNLGESYFRLFLCQDRKTQLENSHFAECQVFACFLSPYNTKLRKKLIKTADYGTQALYIAETPRNINAAASLIVSALTGEYLTSDKQIKQVEPFPDYAAIANYRVRHLQGYVNKFKNKIKTLDPQAKKYTFYETHLSALQQFIENYPERIRNPYLYLLLPRENLHEFWKNVTFSTKYFSISSTALCLTERPTLSSFKGDPDMSPIVNLLNHYKQKPQSPKTQKKIKNLEEILHAEKQDQFNKIANLGNRISVFSNLWTLEELKEYKKVFMVDG